jgi:Na+/H+ antiporter NhaC
MNNLRPGYLTTEFWVSTLATIGAFLAGIGGFLPANFAILAAAISAGAYAISRGLAKQNPNA